MAIPAASKERVRITIEGPIDQVSMQQHRDPHEPYMHLYEVASPVRTVTVQLGQCVNMRLERLPAPEPPKVYTYWRRQTAPFSESTSFRVDEAGQWQIFREGDWQDCIYIRSLEDLAHRAYTLRKSGPE